MKRLGLLVMPLMAVSLLASCGGGSKIPDLPNDLDLYKKKCIYDSETGDVAQTYEYEYNDKNLLIKSTIFQCYFPNEKRYNEWTYDENNNVKTNDFYIVESGVETSRDKTIYENQYDKKKRLIQVITKIYDAHHGEWVISNKREIKYEDNSKVEEYYIQNIMTKEYFLSNKTIYTYDKNDCLTNIKDYDYEINEGTETVITIDKHGCATLSVLYDLSKDNVRGEKVQDIEITYLDNLWYRPLKSVQTPVDSSEGIYITEYAYNDKKQIISEKYYEENAQSPYFYYYTYEY